MTKYRKIATVKKPNGEIVDTIKTRWFECIDNIFFDEEDVRDLWEYKMEGFLFQYETEIGD